MHGSLGNIIWSICYSIVLTGLSIYGLHRYAIVYLFLRNRKKLPKPLREFETLPRITVQLPVFNEMYVVERLLDSVAALDYPKDLLQVQVLDDSTDETTAIAAKRVGELQARALEAGRVEVRHVVADDLEPLGEALHATHADEDRIEHGVFPFIARW